MKDYNIYLQKAYKFMVKEILSDVAKEGLEEGMSLLISFQTDRKDVIIPDFVRAKYPKEISIILQYQFENLIVDNKSFQVDLAFGGVLSTIKVPFSALIQFADQNANFGFILTPHKEITETIENKKSDEEVAEIIDLDRFRKK